MNLTQSTEDLIKKETTAANVKKAGVYAGAATAGFLVAGPVGAGIGAALAWGIRRWKSGGLPTAK